MPNTVDLSQQSYILDLIKNEEQAQLEAKGILDQLTGEEQSQLLTEMAGISSQFVDAGEALLPRARCPSEMRHQLTDTGEIVA